MTMPTFSSRHSLLFLRAGAASPALRLLLLVTLVLVLTGCGNKAVNTAATAADRGEASGVRTKGVTPQPVAQAPQRAVTTHRGGGYYLDDGPPDDRPAGLDTIPDATPRIEPFHQPAFRPYTVFGQQYVPRTALVPFREQGYASWYGRRFHGNPTSNGERYDMFAMTAAHPTLPLPSYARVTNLSNGHSVIVRINDRGPFLRGRVIDLSYAAAHRLGYINAGSAPVVVESITHDDIRVAEARGIAAVPGLAGGGTQLAAAPASSSAHSVPRSPAMVAAPVTPVPPVAAGGSGVPAGAYLQLGAFSTSANAESFAARVRSELSGFADRLHLFDDGGRYRLQLGPFASADDARLEARRIGSLFDLQPFVVMR